MIARFVLAAACGSFVLLSGGRVPQVRGAAAQAPPVASAPAPPASQPVRGRFEPVWLRVIRDDVNIRARPDTVSLIVLRAPRGALLRAVGLDAHGWYRIVPPEGAFCWASAEHVEARGEQACVVAVRSGALRVRAGSQVVAQDPSQAESVAQLARGTPVKILGREGDWLRIAPPAGVHFFIGGELVERITDDEAAGLQATAPRPGGTPGAPRAVRPSAAGANNPPATQPGPTTRRRPGPDLSGAWGRRLAAVEQEIATENAKPLEDQAWPSLIARLRPIAEQLHEPMVARLAAAWISQLEQRINDQAIARAADEILARATRQQAQHERELEQLGRAREITSQPAFSARGALYRSYTPAGRWGHRWYRLLNPLNGRLESYLEFTDDAQVEPETALGQYVGVRGPRRTVPEIGADVVTVRELVILAPPATQPAREGP